MNKRVDGVAGIALLVAGVSFILGLISRFMMQPLPFAPGGILAGTFVAFTNTCLLAAITFILLDIAHQKK